MKNRFLYLAVWLLAIFGCNSASANNFSYCYGGGCWSSPQGYKGPMGSYHIDSDSQDSGNSSKELNKRAYEAYRHGKLKALRQYRVNLQEKLVQYEQEKAGATNTQEFLDKISEQVQANLLTTFPEPPVGVIDQSRRRQINPLPPSLSEEAAQLKLDPVWREIKRSKPFDVVKRLEQLDRKMSSVHPDIEPEIPAEQAQSLRNELEISQIVDGNGLLKAPFATTPKSRLFSSRSSIVGAEIRYGMNKILAAESIIGAKCKSEGAPEDCKKFHHSIQGKLAAFHLMDRISYSQVGQLNSESMVLLKQLQNMADFTVGVGLGVVNGVVSLGEGLLQFANDPGEVTVAIGKALANLPKTSEAIKNILINKYDEFVSGDSLTRGKIVGEAIVLVGAIFLPGTEVVAALEASVFLKTGVALSLAEVSANLVLVSKISAGAIRGSILVERFGAKGARAKNLAQWSQKYLGKSDGGPITAALAKLPERRQLFLEVLDTQLNQVVSQEARQYLVGQVAFEKLIFNAEITLPQARQIAKTYDKLDSKMGTLGPDLIKTQSIEVTRAIPKTWIDSSGVVHKNSKHDVMRFHKGGLYKSHRFSRPTQDMLYGSKGVNAVKTALKEAGQTLESAIVGSKRLQLRRPLDLTNPSIQSSLGVSASQLTVRILEDSMAYRQTQILGELAKKHGFDSIIFPSTANSSGINVGLFPRSN